MSDHSFSTDNTPEAGLARKNSRDKIAKAAIEVFSENGYAAASTREIAERAAVAEGTIFRHFPTKKALLMAVLTPFVQQAFAPMVLQPLVALLQVEYDSLEDFLTALFDDRISLARRHHRLMRVLLQELTVQNELRALAERSFSQTLRPLFVPFIERFQQRGLVVDLPPELVVRLVVTNIVGHIIARYILAPGHDWKDDRDRRAIIDFLVRGLTPPPQPEPASTHTIGRAGGVE